MAFPAVWADALRSATGVTIAAVRLANAVWMMVRREDRIWCTFLMKPFADGSKQLVQYPSAQPSLRGSEPPVSVPLSQSIQIA